MNKLLKLTSVFSKEESTEDTITIEGFANTTTVDRHGDMIVPDAWKQGGLDNFKKNPIILAFHNREMPIGKALDLSVSDRGLHIKAIISKAAGNIFNLIKEGIVSTFSVGFIVKDATYDPNVDIFVIKDLELLEISVVSIPANADSTFSVSKQLGDEGTNMKKEFIDGKSDDASKEDSTDAQPDNTLTQELVKKLDSIAASLAKQVEEKPVAEAIVTKSEAEKIQEEVEKRVLAAIEAKEKAARETADLAAEKQARIDLEKTLGDLKSELAEKATELEAVRKNKMNFQDKDSGGAGIISVLEKETAVMLSKILQKDISDTNYGKRLIEKAGSDNNVHIPATTWEREFVTRAFDDLRQRLVLAPIFSSIPMNALNINIPINPDPAANATWVSRANYGTASASGTAVVTALSEVTMKAHKLAAHEFLIDEEEEDAIIAVAGIIRDALLRRMGRTWDKALLRGAGNEGGGDPITGIATSADTANLEVVMDGALATDKVTVADLQAVRRKLGLWGLDPMDVVYIVSTEAYFDLLDDPDFRTIDLVGTNATILRGQIGAVNGSPVIVSGEFAAKGASVINTVALNKQAFLMGELRSLRLERDREVLNQRELLVASTRVGFVNLIAGMGAAVLKYAAA